ncbi:MAG: leucine-rich repeat domain-containing protein [Lachnospiraceae bacterium]|nr:leucine-rich repeat domain-containing protein [Lachnospiraceae bacterium]
MKQITLLSSIERINGAVFRRNTVLKEVTLPGSVEMLKRSAFRDCENLETVDIRAERIEIEKNVFRGCKNLFDLIIPAGSLVRKSAFIDCPMKECIMVQDDIEAIDDEE